MSTKLAAPVRENYLNELMADYSMVSKGFGCVCAFDGRWHIENFSLP